MMNTKYITGVLLIFAVGLASVTTNYQLITTNSAHADDFEPADIDENATNNLILDADDSGGDISLQFGATLGETIRWNAANVRFEISDNLDFLGNQLINARLENLAAAPTCDASAAGRQYFDTGSGSTFTCNGTTWVTSNLNLLDEDDLVSDSDSAAASQQSIKAYVDNRFEREMNALNDGKYVIEKDGTTYSYRQIFNEFPGGVSLFGGPDQVLNLNSGVVSNSSIEISWSPATTSDGTTITDYEIQFRVNGTTTWTTIADGTSTNTTYDATGLTASTDYDFRVRAFSDQFGPFSTEVTAGTLPADPFFDPSVFTAMNVGGATTSQVVAFDDTTNITLNGAPLTTLNGGQTFQFASAQFDVIEADNPIFVAGEIGSDNHVWSVPYWAGTEFSFNTLRNDPQFVYVYAWEAATVELRDGAGTLIDSSTLAAGGTDTLTWNGATNYHLTSTGTILPFQTSNGPVDQKALLPASTQIIGFPSSSMQLTSTADSNNYTGIHSNGVNTANTADRTTVITITPQGTTSLYQSEALVINADAGVTGASYADSNGTAAAPFVPTSLMRNRYATNVATEWIAFASMEAGTIDIIDGAGTVTGTLTLTRSGADTGAPYIARTTGQAAGTRYTATVPVAAWYEPSTNTAAGNDDETVMFGTD